MNDPLPPMPCTRQQFLAEYRAQLLALYAWAQNPEELAEAMLRAEEACKGRPPPEWSHKAPAVLAAWQALTGRERGPTPWLLSRLTNEDKRRRAA